MQHNDSQAHIHYALNMYFTFTFTFAYLLLLTLLLFPIDGLLPPLFVGSLKFRGLFVFIQLLFYISSCLCKNLTKQLKVHGLIRSLDLIK